MNDHTCNVEKCEELARVRGMCRRHYNKAYYQANKEVRPKRALKNATIPPFTCKWCGKDHPEAVPTVARKQVVRKFCDRECGNKFSSAQQSAERAAARAALGRKCQQCGVGIDDRNRQARFCSALCSDIAAGRRRAEPLTEIECALEECQVVFTPKSRIQKCCCTHHGQVHYNRVSRATGRQKPEPWSDRRRANHHKRRALKKKLPAADIRPLDIYERDSWTCGLCGDGIDPDTAWPDPLSASLDHILPLSKGGHHVPENVQAAHLSCNVRKGNRVEADAMSA